MIWKQQPVASELRAIAGALQIVTDLERIGDYAVDISKNAIKLIDVPVRPASVEIGQIAAVAQTMLADAMRAYREGRRRGRRLGHRTRRRGRWALPQRHRGAAERDAGGSRAVVPAGTILLFVLATIERVGDRAQNIAWKTKDIYSS